MAKYLTINSYLKKDDQKYKSSLPKLTINSCYNISIYNNKIYPNHNYCRTENKLINTEASSKFNNYMLLNKKSLKSSNKSLFKTILFKKNTSLSKSKNEKLFSRNSHTNLFRKTNPINTNKSQKIPLKLMNDFFKPEITKSNKTIFTPKKLQRTNKIFNFSSEGKKEMYPNNYLYYYYPNLFNVPNNRIMSETRIDPSKYLIAPIPTKSFDEEVKSLKDSQLKNQNDNEYINGKSLYSSIITNSKDNEKQQNNPVFIEKSYSFDILKNLRFGFKNSVEKGKFRNFINSFYTSRNLKFILPKYN